MVQEVQDPWWLFCSLLCILSCGFLCSAKPPACLHIDLEWMQVIIVGAVVFIAFATKKGACGLICRSESCTLYIIVLYSMYFSFICQCSVLIFHSLTMTTAVIIVGFMSQQVVWIIDFSLLFLLKTNQHHHSQMDPCPVTFQVWPLIYGFRQAYEPIPTKITIISNILC